MYEKGLWKKVPSHGHSFFCSSVLLVIFAGCVMPSPGGTNATITPPSQTPQNTAPPSPASQISIAQGPTFECNLFENPPHNLGIAGADLGVPIVVGPAQWLIFGDTMAKSATSMAGPSDATGGSSVIQSSIPFSCANFSWVTAGSSYLQPLTSKRIVGVDASTVPGQGRYHLTALSTCMPCGYCIGVHERLLSLRVWRSFPAGT